ncbi:hypothetical protein KFE25_012230 [Diacronema lutheri]|uniref:Uncharacterized protein n=2 Tax=Diacronema lutheri TaxID=2081491 RepID=A0A8J6CAA4_DIALT|nr:hypothetical protein KFE25_012230 [Diacronema lutheri]
MATSVDGCCPVPFDLISPNGCHSRTLAVLVFGGLTLRAFLSILAQSFGDDALPRCAPRARAAPGAFVGLGDSLGSLWQALPFACVLGLANSRWHGAGWRLLALPYAAVLLAESSALLVTCSAPPRAGAAEAEIGSSRSGPVRHQVARMLAAVDVFVFAGVLVCLLALVLGAAPRATGRAAGPPASPADAELERACGSAGAGPSSGDAAIEPCATTRPSAGLGGATAHHAAKARGPVGAPAVPLRLWVGLWLSLAVVLLICVAQLYAARLLSRVGSRRVAELLDAVRRAEAQLERTAGAESTGSADARWLLRVVRQAERVLSAYALPVAHAVGPSAAAGALVALCNDLRWKAVAICRCRRIVPRLRAAHAERGDDCSRHRREGGGHQLAGAAPVPPSAGSMPPPADSARALSVEPPSREARGGGGGSGWGGGGGSGWGRGGGSGWGGGWGGSGGGGGAERALGGRRQSRSVDVHAFSVYWAFYLIPVLVANSAVAFALVSASVALLAFTIACAPVRAAMWTSWVTAGYVGALGVDYSLRVALFQGVLATRDGPRLARLFRLADFAYSFTLGPVAGTSAVFARCVAGGACALAALARVDVPMLPRALAVWDPAFAAWQAMLKLHVNGGGPPLGEEASTGRRFMSSSVPTASLRQQLLCN